jgi:hydroxyacylglutathione hydrolase
MQIPIEDFYEDVIAKAARGMGMAASRLSELSGVDKDAIRDAMRGNFVEEEARKIAPFLNLDPDALVLLGKGTWRPAEVEVPGLALFNTPFGDMTVNAFVVWDPATKDAAVFDSGADASEMIAFIKAQQLKVRGVWVTHTHGDHIEDIRSIVEATNCPVYVGEKELANFGESFPSGREFNVGSLHIETRLTWGHARGGITYIVTGLERPLAIVGDALFAQSMGGGMVSYKDALETSGREIMTLPENTIICPGHGPLTSVAEEKQVNPFFAGKF